MPAINPPLVREEARARFFDLLRARYWTEQERSRIEIDPEAVLGASDVVDELAEEPLALFREIRSELLAEQEATLGPNYSFQGVPISTRLPEEGRPFRHQDPRFVHLHELVINWAARWHLRAEWCVRCAFLTMERWCYVPRTFERRGWAPLTYALILKRITFEITEWDGIRPLSVFKAESQERLVAQLDAHVDKLRSEADAVGAPAEFTRMTGSPYRWTIRAQVLGETITAIAEDEGVARTTVDEAVKLLLQHLDLPIRPRRAGRPKGAADRKPRIRATTKTAGSD